VSIGQAGSPIVHPTCLRLTSPVVVRRQILMLFGESSRPSCHVTGRPLDQLMQDKVLGPSGRRSWFLTDFSRDIFAPELLRIRSIWLGHLDGPGNQSVLTTRWLRQPIRRAWSTSRSDIPVQDSSYSEPRSCDSYRLTKRSGSNFSDATTLDPTISVAALRQIRLQSASR
jgi:hypothetical protein